MTIFKFNSIALVLSLLLLCQGCDTVNDERIPNMPVNISLTDIGIWNTYGVSGFGSYTIFTLSPRQPLNFPFSAKTYTGFGGVLLIEGIDPFTGISSQPLAYDIACPVERQSDARIKINCDYMAVCQKCGSVFDVTMQRGTPVSGPAASSEYKYGLRTYNCIPYPSGGYLITN